MEFKNAETLEIIQYNPKNAIQVRRVDMNGVTHVTLWQMFLGNNGEWRHCQKLFRMKGKDGEDISIPVKIDIRVPIGAHAEIDVSEFANGLISAGQKILELIGDTESTKGTGFESEF